METYKIKIDKYLKKRKEDVVADLQIYKYGRANLYLAIVFNKEISMYKVLYIPLDIVYNSKIEDFVCYQFIDVNSIKYLSEGFRDNKDRFNSRFCNCTNKLIDTYKIIINSYIDNEHYQFLATRYIPPKWAFMFEFIVTLFQHSPNIISDLCEDLLTLFKDSTEDIKYQDSFNFNLTLGSDEFLNEKFGKETFDKSDIKQLEQINNKYFCMIENELVIIENDYGLLNIYCSCKSYNKYVLTTINAIRENFEKKFSKIMVLDKDNVTTAKYYLVFGYDDRGFKILDGVDQSTLKFNKYKDGLVKIIEDYHGLKEIKK